MTMLYDPIIRWMMYDPIAQTLQRDHSGFQCIVVRLWMMEMRAIMLMCNPTTDKAEIVKSECCRRLSFVLGGIMLNAS